MADEFTQFKKFAGDANDFPRWKRDFFARMELKDLDYVLELAEIKEVLLKGKAEKVSEEEKELLEDNKRVWSYLCISIDTKVIEKLSGCAKNGNAAWKKLLAIYEARTKDPSRLLELRNKLFRMKFKIGDDYEEFLEKMDKYISEIKEIEGESAVFMPMVIQQFFNNLPDAFSGWAIPVANRENLTWADTKMEFRKAAKFFDSKTNAKLDPVEEILYAKGNKRSFRNKSKSGKEQRKKICYYCGRKGHEEEECFHKKRAEKLRRGRKREEKAHEVEEDFIEEATLGVADYLSDEEDIFFYGSEKNQAMDAWIMDSGATSHMCHQKELFTKLDQSKKSSIYLANEHKLRVEGVGQINLTVKDSQGRTSTLVLNKVLYIPNLSRNLISIGTLIQDGFAVSLTKDGGSLTTKGKSLIPIKPIGKLYFLTIEPVEMVKIPLIKEPKKPAKPQVKPTKEQQPKEEVFLVEQPKEKSSEWITVGKCKRVRSAIARKETQTTRSTKPWKTQRRNCEQVLTISSRSQDCTSNLKENSRSRTQARVPNKRTGQQHPLKSFSRNFN